MKPETVTITTKDFERLVSVLVNAQDFVYFFEEKPSIIKWIFKKITGSLVWHQYLGLEKSINKYRFSKG